MLAFVLIAVVAVLIGATISRPAWFEQVGYQQPAHTVAFGQKTVFGGVTMWLVGAVTPPPMGRNEDAPKGSRLAAYVINRERNGAPASQPDGMLDCEMSMTDGRRVWQGRPSYEVKDWGEEQGYTSDCWDEGPVLVAMYVPADAKISAVRLNWRRTAEEVPEGQPLPPPYELWTMLEFQTG